MSGAPRVTVVGSANVDLVARCERLPRDGETVTDAASASGCPGGKGANQAVAAARLGAADPLRRAHRRRRPRAALARSARGSTTSGVVRDAGESGVALILVDDAGENVIVVAPGANARLAPADVDVGDADAVLVPARDPRRGRRGGGRGRPLLLPQRGPGPRPAPGRARPARRQPLRVRGGRRGRRAGRAHARRGGGGAARGRGRGRPREAARRQGGRRDRGAGDAFCAAPGRRAARRARSAARRSTRACAAGALAAARGRARSRRCRRPPSSRRCWPDDTR